uniref:Uncharacterized protein n=1 Tax=Anguilla anguilla TaxID=7936 RepID=A0A0E9WN36_ANGAN
MQSDMNIMNGFLMPSPQPSDCHMTHAAFEGHMTHNLKLGTQRTPLWWKLCSVCTSSALLSPGEE